MNRWRIRAFNTWQWAVHALAHILYFPSRWRMQLRNDPRRRLHVGCGRNRLEGWINADIDPRAELIVLLERPLPFADASLDRIYLEHVLEHSSYENGLRFLREARRALSPGGVVRIAVPDLENLVRGYLNDDWRRRLDWVKWPEFAFIKTRAQMLNVSFRWWGHAHLYDKEELTRILGEAGFADFEFVAHGESRHDDLRALETRLDSTLVVEATKTR